MADLFLSKVVSSLPGTPVANALYLVKVGTGFRPYVTNSTGTIVAYGLDPIAWSELAGPSRPLAERDLVLAELSTGLRDFSNAFADGFNDSAGIDAANSSAYLVTGGYVAPSGAPTGYTSVASLVLNTNVSNAGYTHRSVIAASQLTDLTSTHVRVKLTSATNANTVIDNAYLGIKSGTYGYASTPVQLLFGGSASTTLISGAVDTYSDPVLFEYDGLSDLVVAVYASSGNRRYYNTTSTGWTAYYKSGSDAATTGPTGYTAPSFASYVISGIEAATSFAVGNLDLRTISRAIATVPTAGDLYALVEETDALTLDTDIKLYVGRDGDTSYAQGTAQRIALANGRSLIYATGIDLTGQSSAANLRGRITTHNTKACKVHAHAVYGRAG